MGAKTLSERENWQTKNGKKATLNERNTLKILSSLQPDIFKILKKPSIKIGNINLEPEIQIENLTNGKKLIIDDKLGERGGNAHERLYKYFTGKVQQAGYIPLVVLSGNTFSSEGVFSYEKLDRTKTKKIIVKVNPQRYRDELASLLEQDQYFILNKDASNREELIIKVKELLK